MKNALLLSVALIASEHFSGEIERKMTLEYLTDPTFSALYALSRDNYFSGLVRRQAAPASRGRLFSASESGGEETFEWSRLGGFGSNKVGYRSGQTGQTVNLLA